MYNVPSFETQKMRVNVRSRVELEAGIHVLAAKDRVQ
jgi:hypothetical protein